MITWEYRVFQEDNGEYIIREVFYDDEGCLVGCTQDAVEPYGSSLEELTKQIEAFKQALTLPILTLADVPIRENRTKHQKNSQTLSSKKIMTELGLI